MLEVLEVVLVLLVVDVVEVVDLCKSQNICHVDNTTNNSRCGDASCFTNLDGINRR